MLVLMLLEVGYVVPPVGFGRADNPLTAAPDSPQIVPVVWKHGFFYAICNNKSWTPRLETYYIVNYLFKYWELADTMFLVVKKKPLGASRRDYVARAGGRAARPRPGRSCSPVAPVGDGRMK